MFNRHFRFFLRHAAIPLAKRMLHPLVAKFPRCLGKTLGLQPLPPAFVVPQAEDYAVQSGHDARCYVQAAPEEKLVRRPPICLDGHPDWRIERHLIGVNPPLFLATLPGGRVVGNSGAVITSDDVLLGDLSFDWFLRAEQHPLRWRLRLPPIQHLKGQIITLARLSGWNYAHWIMDVLPRLAIVGRAGVDWKKADGFIVNGPESDFKKDTLELLGIPLEKCFWTSKNSHFRCETLLAPSLTCEPNETPPWVVEFLRDAFAKKTSSESSTKRIYISRAKAGFRKLLNEHEIMALVAKRGFQNVICEDLPFREKVGLFSSAEAVVGAHGAGLIHLAFCRPGTKVLEFYSPRYVNNNFWTLSNAGGLEYGYVMGKGKRPRRNNDPHDAECDILVDPGDVEKMLDRLKL